MPWTSCLHSINTELLELGSRCIRWDLEVIRGVEIDLRRVSKKALKVSENVTNTASLLISVMTEAAPMESILVNSKAALAASTSTGALSSSNEAILKAYIKSPDKQENTNASQ